MCPSWNAEKRWKPCHKADGHERQEGEIYRRSRRSFCPLRTKDNCPFVLKRLTVPLQVPRQHKRGVQQKRAESFQSW